MEPKTKQSNQFRLQPSNQFRNENGCMRHELKINQLNNLMESKTKRSNQFGLKPSNQFRNKLVLKVPPVDESLSTPIATPNWIVSRLPLPLQSKL